MWLIKLNVCKFVLILVVVEENSLPLLGLNECAG